MNTITFKPPLVSVLMPAKNAEKFINESIDSVLNQSLESFELIVIDDDSNDGTETILEDYLNKDSRVRIVKSNGNGIVDALNSGIEHVQAPLIARMDADDISSKHRLKLQYEKFESNKNLVLLGSYYYVFNGEISNIEAAVTPPMDNEKLKLSIQSLSTYAHPTIMIKTEAIRKIGGYRKFFEGAEDHDLYLRLSEFGEFSTVPDFLLHYRTHSGQLSRVKQAMGYRASVAAAFCNQCVRENNIDPLTSGKSRDELAFEMLIHASESRKSLTKGSVLVCVQAVKGLAQLPEYTERIFFVRKKIVIKLIKTRKFKLAYKFWQKTRRTECFGQQKIF